MIIAQEVTSAFQAAAYHAREQWQRGFNAVRTRNLGAYGVVAVSLWLFGILGDLTTTLVMMGTGLTEEGNPAAAFGMSIVGPEIYSILISLFCVFLAIPTLALPKRNIYQIAIWGTLAVVGLGKVYIVFSNAFLAFDILGWL